jgi:hypothetical protein
MEGISVKTSERATIGMIAAWFVSYFAARAGLEFIATPWVRVALAILPIPFFVAFVWLAMRAIDRGDEMFRRAHLEALALAFPLTVVLLMVLGLFELATGLDPNDWSYRHIWPIVVILYYFGWWRAWKRYQ